MPQAEALKTLAGTVNLRGL